MDGRKRAAETELTKDNFENSKGDDDEENTGSWLDSQVASEEELASRKIVKVKRKAKTIDSSAPKPVFNFGFPPLAQTTTPTTTTTTTETKTANTGEAKTESKQDESEASKTKDETAVSQTDNKVESTTTTTNETNGSEAEKTKAEKSENDETTKPKPEETKPAPFEIKPFTFTPFTFGGSAAGSTAFSDLAAKGFASGFLFNTSSTPPASSEDQEEGGAVEVQSTFTCKPVVEVKLVESKTGEEGDEILHKARVKVYSLTDVKEVSEKELNPTGASFETKIEDKTKSESSEKKDETKEGNKKVWQECGVGEIHLNKFGEGKYRLVMHSEKVRKAILNSMILPHLPCSKQDDTRILFTGCDEKGQPRQHLIRLKTQQDRDEFYEQLKKYEGLSTK